MAGNRFTDLIPDDMDVKAKRKKPLTEKQKASLCKPKGEQLRKTYGEDALFDSLKAPVLDPEARKAKSTLQYQKTKRQREAEKAEAAPAVSETQGDSAPANVEVHDGKVWVPEMNRYMSIDELQSQLNVLKKSQITSRARENFLDFIRYMFPDFEDPDNPDKSMFEVARHHALIAEKLEAVERGDCKRLIITIRPRAGKSEMVSRMFSAWYMGKHLADQVIAAGYNYDFAVDEIGSKVLAILQSERYREVFPEFQLRTDKKSAGIMRNTKGGQLAVAGVGGSLTGRGAHCVMPWTKIETTEGSLTFDELLSRGQYAPSVLSYKDGMVVPRRIHAFATRKSDHYFRIQTSTGVLEATGEHPVCVGFDGAKPLFRRVDDLRVGDELVAIDGTSAFRAENVRRVPDVRRSVHAQPGQVPAGESRRGEPESHMLERLQGTLALHRKGRGTGLRGMRTAIPGVGVRRGSEEGQGASPVLLFRKLLRGVSLSYFQRGGSPEVFGSINALRQLWGRIHPEPVLRGENAPGEFVLRQGMLRGSYPWRAYPTGYRDSSAEILPVRVQANPGSGDEDEPKMCRVRVTREGLASQGRRQGEQRLEQSGGSVPVLPRGAPQGPSYSRVESIERIDGDFTVGDLEVEDTHTYLLSSQHLIHNCLILDDLFKNWEDAESQRYRDTVWSWYTSTAKTRLMKGGRVIIIMTRWHEDDIVGRLTDPTNEFYKEAIAKGFEVLEIPDVAGDGVDIKKDPLNRQPGEVLWPEWFPDDALEMKTQDERVYYALYQGQPRPPGGVFFKEEQIQTYGNHERPALQDLTIYGSCDLSASPERDRDASVFMIAGMDRAGVLWILDIWWERVASDDAVDFILAECTRYHPTIVFWESGPITKTITPFLERRMRETRQYTYFETYPATANKAARARGIRGMMAAGMVRFPRDHEKFPAVKNQLLKFTGSGKDNEDDAVDTLSGFGMMLTRQTNYTREQTEPAQQPRNVITLDWIKRSSREQERRERLRKARRGM